MTELDLSAYPVHSTDKIRYGDTDRQGHVNNAVFATYLETGRVEWLDRFIRPFIPDTTAFVIARLELNFRAEILWPGSVVIGSRIGGFGTSSIKLSQVIFQGDICAAAAESVVVLVDTTTRKSTPLTTEIKDKLKGLLHPA